MKKLAEATSSTGRCCFTFLEREKGSETGVTRGGSITHDDVISAGFGNPVPTVCDIPGRGATWRWQLVGNGPNLASSQSAAIVDEGTWSRSWPVALVLRLGPSGARKDGYLLSCGCSVAS